MSLLERHLHLLKSVGVEEVVIAVGYRRGLVEAELERLAWMPRPETVVNDRFELGSVLTVDAAADAMTRGGDVRIHGCGTCSMAVRSPVHSQPVMTR